MLNDMMTVAELEDSQLKYTPHLIDFSFFVEVIMEEFRLIDQNDHMLTVDYTLKGTRRSRPQTLASDPLELDLKCAQVFPHPFGSQPNPVSRRPPN